MPSGPPIRSLRRLASLHAAAPLLAPAARAQNQHFLSATVGSGMPVGESTCDPGVSDVEAQWADGVPGTTGGGRELSASANSASGGANLPTSESESFLTLPEPGAAGLALAACAALGALARRRSGPIVTPRRGLAPWLAACCVVWLASAAQAQNSHFLTAQCGQSTATNEDFTYSTADPSVQVLCSEGVPGTEAGGREISARADSERGLLRASGTTDEYLSGNRRRGLARIEQRMFPDPGGSSPITVRVTLDLTSSGLELARNYAEIQVGDCLAYVTHDIGGASPGAVSGEVDCDDTGVVDWTTSGSASLLTVEAAYGLSPSSLNLAAGVTGYLGNGTIDIPTAQFFVSGVLRVEQIGGNAPTFASDTFLTLPEPDAAGLALAAVAALGALARRR